VLVQRVQSKLRIPRTVGHKRRARESTCRLGAEA
jgi:hypothetical protein